MLLNVVKISDYAKQCDALMTDDNTRDRVEDTLGLQRIGWSIYEELEKGGAALLIVAQDNDELAGLDLYVMYNHPHHPGKRLAQCALLRTRPTYRGKGLGRALVEYAIPELKSRECTHVIHNRRMAYDIKPLFPKIGFELFEEVYIRELS